MPREGTNNSKPERILKLFFRALKGEALSVSEIATENNVSARSITRDINDLKAFLAEHRDSLGNAELKYSSGNHCYTLEIDSIFTNKELFAISKVLIGSRALGHKELGDILQKLKNHTSHSDKKTICEFTESEINRYSEDMMNHCNIIENVWELSSYIHERRVVLIRHNHANLKVLPLSVVFNEFFYLVAYRYAELKQNTQCLPVTFRLSDISEINPLREKMTISSYYLLNEKIFRKSNMYVCNGIKRKILFEFYGPSPQVIFDYLPTAKIIEHRDSTYLIESEVYGDGIKMFLLSHGSYIKVISPVELVNEIKLEIKNMHTLY